MTDVVIGTGPLGLAVVRELMRRGKPVRAVNRSGRADVPAGVQVVAGDITDAAFGREVARGAHAIYLCAKPKYERVADDFDPIMDGAIAAAEATNAPLVYGDNIYPYGPVDKPLTEDLPYAATGRKGIARARIATRLMEAHAAGRIRATIGRSSEFFGPYVRESLIGERVFGFAVQGRAASVLGNPDTLFTYTYIDDFARGLVTLGEHDEAMGQVWHVPCAETLTTRQFVTLIFEELGKPVRLQVVPRWAITLLAPFSPLIRELPEVMYQSERDLVVNHDKFDRAFGAMFTPHREAIHRTVEWYRANDNARAHSGADR